jgi:alkylhydroperoxidase family enzyme
LKNETRRDDAVSRILPLEAPYEPEIGAQLERMMPAGVPPIALFRMFVRNLPMATAMWEWGGYELSRRLSLSMREREIVIDRTTARCGAEYEWGVHAVFFGPRAALSPAELAATVTEGPASPVWSEDDRLLLRLADELHETAHVSDALWAALAGRWNPAQLLELVLVVGWYHAIAFLVNATRVEREAWAPAFPAPGAFTPDA